jgi:hypothetical protein
VGLGFTYHTRRLLSLSGLLGNVDIEWHEHTRTDAIKFGHELFFEPHSPTEDVALVVRIVLGNGNVHFICAGRTASGTAAAGRYLSDHWDNIRDAYANHSGCDVSTHSLAVLIKHPSGFDAVCNKTERAFQVIMSASEFHVMP